MLLSNYLVLASPEGNACWLLLCSPCHPGAMFVPPSISPSSVYPVVCSSAQSIHPSVYLHSPIQLSIRSSTHLTIYSAIHLSVHSSIYPFTHPSVHLFTQLPSHLSTYTSTPNLLTNSSIHPPIHVFTCLFIHPFIYIFISPSTYPTVLPTHTSIHPFSIHPFTLHLPVNLSILPPIYLSFIYDR